MTDRIVLVERDDRRAHVLALAHAAAVAEMTADWAKRRADDERHAAAGVLVTSGRVALPSLRDFLGR